MATSQPVELTFQDYRQSLPSTISEADAYQGYLIEKKRINEEAVSTKAEQLEKEKQKTMRMQQGLPAKFWSLFLTSLSTALGIFTGLTAIRLSHDNPQQYVRLLWGYQKCFGTDARGVGVAEGVVPADRPFVIRLDGVAFSTFTRGLARPFEVKTAEDLLLRFNPVTAYTSSDEISLVFPAATPGDEVVEPENACEPM